MDTTKRRLVVNGMLGLSATGIGGRGAAAAIPASVPASIDGRLKAIELQLARQDSVQAVANVMSSYELYLQLGCLHEALQLFALKSHDVKVDVGWGVYEGPASVRRLYLGVHKLLIGDRREPQTLKPGAYYALANTTTVIEVAGDNRTAKGLWVCPGFSTPPDGKGKRSAVWGYAKRAVDFIREGTAWKIWHYQIYGIFYTPYLTPWTDTNNAKNLNFAWLPAGLGPDKPATTARDAMYSPDRPVPSVPLPPVPYGTFSETYPYL